jgi:pimeloyl-ACP methyl ester carboxylesterase
MEIAEASTLGFTLKILPEGGGLIDIPTQNLYGYPLSGLGIQGKRLVFTLGADPASLLRFDASLVGPEVPPRGGAPFPRLEGYYSKVEAGVAAGGRFSLVALPTPASDDLPFDVEVSGGKLRGSLLLPAGEGPFPLVILIAGAGTTDRNGNNYNVPGRNDALLLLARALRAEGVASYRYDKRGSGESYALQGREEDSRFSDYVDDASFVLNAFEPDPRFSRIVLAGHTEGALVAAAVASEPFLSLGGAASRESPQDPDGTKLAGLVLLCATGRTAAETVETALADTPAPLKPEAAAIMSALKSGKTYPSPSSYFADFFRPSFQPYLASWFSYDIKSDLAAFRGEVALVQGNMDFQVSLAEFDILHRVRPEAPAFVLPDMNHALKAVSGDLEENYRSFSDPSFPLADGLAAIIAAVAKGSGLPSAYPFYEGSTGAASAWK